MVHSLAGGSSLGGVNLGPAPPDAPRKSAAKLAYLQQQRSQESSIEDIEDSFQDTTTSPHAAKLLPHAAGPPPLQLKRTRDEPAVVTGCSKAPSATIQLEVSCSAFYKSTSNDYTFLLTTFLRMYI